MEKHDAVIIGGGPAGLAAAVALRRKKIEDILILEREKSLGGILRQCIHDGFGLTRFGENLSGPEYASRFVEEVERMNIPFCVNASVTSVTREKTVTVITPGNIKKIQAKAIVFAMGCRERTRGALGIPGERPSGVFTAGVAQAYMNLYNRMPGRDVVILGSGDIGMIMARRLTLEGAKVHAVFEIQPEPSGLNRNIVQCLEDYDIPLYLSHTITAIHGKERVTGVTVSEVDERMQPVPGTEKEWPCDTVILSVGLIPENELSLEAGILLDPGTRGAMVDESLQTSRKGFFAAGNVLHVHDLVDYVSQEAEILADHVAAYLKGEELPECGIMVRPGNNVHDVLPQRISGCQKVQLSLRVTKRMSHPTICICQGGKILQMKPLRKAIPAEMIRVALEPLQTDELSEIEVSVE